MTYSNLHKRTTLVQCVRVINMNLKETRMNYGASQQEVAMLLNVPVRTYRRYETDENYGSLIKRNAFIDKINKHFEITEDKGLLSIESIKQKLSDLFNNEYKGQVSFCYLFGSYAKGYATEKSDVDVCLLTSLDGFRYFGLAESIRNTLHKKVDMVGFDSLIENPDLLKEIMKDGIKIYG